MKVIPKLYLNESPQTAENCSLAFARNMKIDNDGNLVSDYGYEDIKALKDYNIVGHIVGLDDKLYIFCNSSKNGSEIYEYDEDLKSIKKIECGWKYNGGEISGCVTTNISGEKILSIAEYIDNDEVLIPLKHINLSFCSSTDDESLYTQAPKVPMCNLTLNNTYAKTIPNGTYIFFIRYKIRKDCYTNWYLCSRPIFGGTSTKITTLQGGVQYINLHTDSAKSFIFDISFVNDEAKALYKGFQLGFIINHNDATDARSWKEFDMSTTKIYFDYENVEEINIDNLLATTYEIYNVRNITNFKNKLYISNYKESNININETELTKHITVSEETIDYTKDLTRTLTFNGYNLLYNNKLGYYDGFENGSIQETLNNIFIFDYSCSNFYKGNTLEKDRLASFDIKWDAANNPDVCTVHNIFNSAYDNAVFGPSVERVYGKGLIGISRVTENNGLWKCIIDTNNKHPWYDLGFTFIYGSALEEDATNYSASRNGVFLFNKNTELETENTVYWNTRDRGFSNAARDFILKNIKDEIEAKNRVFFSHLEVSYIDKTYSTGRNDLINNNTYIGDSNTEIFDYTTANTTTIFPTISSKIKTEVYNEIKQTIIGIDENGSILIRYENKDLRINAITAVFKAVKFDVEFEDIEDNNDHYYKRCYINASITEYKSICTFTIKNNYISINDNVESFAQTPVLMPYSDYKVYAHFVTENHIITNGILLRSVETLSDYSKLNVAIDSTFTNNTNYKSFFISIVNVGNYVAEGFNYRKVGNTNIINCLELDCLLYNITTNIIIKDQYDNEITNNAKYNPSSSSNPILAFGNCGFISWDDNKDYSNSKFYIIIERNSKTEQYYNLIKCSNYIALNPGVKDTSDKFYGSYLCVVKKPDFDLSSKCYVSGNDIYSADRETSLSLKEFEGYIQLQNSPSFIIASNFNLNYLSLTEDINDQIFTVGAAISGVKQVAKIINSATLSYIYELKSMYKDFMNKTFSTYDDSYKIQFDNTIKVSNVLSDETFNNDVFKFEATNYYNIPTNRGIIVNLFSIGNIIYAHTKASLYKFDATQTITTNDKDIQLQEAEPFEVGLNQVFDSQYGYGGIDNKEAGCITFDSYFFYDNKSNHIFAYSGTGQMQIIDGSIYKLLDTYKPNKCRTLHDIVNKRILFEFYKFKGNLPANYSFTLSYNYKSKTFVSIHDITLNNSFSTINNIYSYNETFIKLFNSNDINIKHEILYAPLNIYKLYGGASKMSFLIFTKSNNSPFNISIILFPIQHLEETINSLTYIANIIEKNIAHKFYRNPIGAITYYDELNIPISKPNNPVKSINILTDICESNVVNSTIDDTQRPNSLLDYTGIKYNKGFWNINYFRDIKNNTDIYKYNSINSDNKSLVYGKIFIININFINDKPIKFEDIFINTEKY